MRAITIFENKKKYKLSFNLPKIKHSVQQIMQARDKTISIKGASPLFEKLTMAVLFSKNRLIFGQFYNGQTKQIQKKQRQLRTKTQEL